MDCKNTQLLFSDAKHGRLAAEVMTDRQLHLEDCPLCGGAEKAEQELTRALERYLPQHPASPALKRQLEARWLPKGESAKLRRLWRAAFIPAAVTAATLAALAVGYHLGKPTERGESAVVMEAVNDHLRFLDGETPLQVLASDLHQVKPWFAGKLDFAPPVHFRGDDDTPLVGGEVSRFLDGRVAHFVFARRLHKISLFVLPVESGVRGGEATGGRGPAFGASPALAGVSRGFSLVGWQGDEFAYLLVSDLNPEELLALGQRIQAAR